MGDEFLAMMAYVANDPSHQLYYTFTDDGASWDPAYRIEGQSSASAPVLTSSDDRSVDIFYVADDDSRTLLTSHGTLGATPGPVDWSWPEPLAGQSSPWSPAVTRDGDVVVYVADNAQRTLLVTSRVGTAWQPSRPVVAGPFVHGVSSPFRPVVIQEPDALTICYVAADGTNDLCTAVLTGTAQGTEDTTPQRIEGQSSAVGPSSFAGFLQLLYVADDGSNQILGTTVKDPVAGTWWPPHPVAGHFSRDTPAMAELQHGFVLAYTANDDSHRIYSTFTRSYTGGDGDIVFEWGDAHATAHYSPTAPSIAAVHFPGANP